MCTLNVIGVSNRLSNGEVISNLCIYYLETCKLQKCELGTRGSFTHAEHENNLSTVLMNTDCSSFGSNRIYLDRRSDKSSSSPSEHVRDSAGGRHVDPKSHLTSLKLNPQLNDASLCYGKL